MVYVQCKLDCFYSSKASLPLLELINSHDNAYSSLRPWFELVRMPGQNILLGFLTWAGADTRAAAHKAGFLSTTWQVCSLSLQVEQDWVCSSCLPSALALDNVTGIWGVNQWKGAPCLPFPLTLCLSKNAKEKCMLYVSSVSLRQRWHWIWNTQSPWVLQLCMLSHCIHKSFQL